ncbi:hypothetical protein [Natrialba chahannaoensis]|uniref:hypothetical protein n=1 Tax=Natrialba chahannaoensis TaxID=68911 RepID=UPI000B31EA0C|nr:hypothetical protein [Natrialba chahannaoensis]
MGDNPEQQRRRTVLKSVPLATVCGSISLSTLGTATSNSANEYEGVVYNPSTMDNLGGIKVELNEINNKIKGDIKINFNSKKSPSQYSFSLEDNPQFNENGDGVEFRHYSTTTTTSEVSKEESTKSSETYISINKNPKSVSGFVEGSKESIGYVALIKDRETKRIDNNELINPEEENNRKENNDDGDVETSHASSDLDFEGDLIAGYSYEYENEGTNDSMANYELAVGALGEEGETDHEKIRRGAAKDWCLSTFFVQEPDLSDSPMWSPNPESYSFYFEPDNDEVRRNGMVPDSISDTDSQFDVSLALSVGHGPFSAALALSSYETSPESINGSYNNNTQHAKWTLEAERFPEDQEESYGVLVGVKDNVNDVYSLQSVPIGGRFRWTVTHPNDPNINPTQSTIEVPLYPSYQTWPN